MNLDKPQVPGEIRGWAELVKFMGIGKDVIERKIKLDNFPQPRKERRRWQVIDSRIGVRPGETLNCVWNKEEVEKWNRENGPILKRRSIS